MAVIDDTSPLNPGDIFGDYTVERVLGKGNMGTVYLMRSTTGELFAVKIMHRGVMSHDLRVRFVREADFAMKIRHKNLISVYDVGEDPDSGLCYIIMDYVPGGTLADRIKERGTIPVNEAIKITMHIAAALDVAHRNGLVHRDVKPDNIMFAADGTPKLADLGVAKFDDGHSSTMVTMTGMMIGTPAYMSPEQLIDSHKIDARSDIYSLGIVLYEMISGKRPNSGSSAVELLARAIKGEPLPDIRTMCPETSAAVAHVLSLMCAPKPEDRPETSVAAANLLRRAATGKLVLPKKPPRATDVRKENRVLTVVTAVASTVFAVALVASGILYYLRRDADGSVAESIAKESPGESVESSSLTSESYVQDGLVAMWDGIENAGRGRHDSLARDWKNLVGGPDAVPADGRAAWSGNAALFGKGRYYLLNTLFGELQSVTVEVCHRASPMKGAALFSSCEFGGIGIQGDNRPQWQACVANPAGGYYSEIKMPALRNHAETLAFTVNDVFTVYRNAKVFGMVSGISGIRYNKNHQFQIGRDPGGDGEISGEIHSIRLYSRPLSADEIRRNYEIDRVRFNLDRVCAPKIAPAISTASSTAAEREKSAPVSIGDFKARLTGVAVCDAKKRKFDKLEFLPPTAHLEVAPGKMAVFRVEYDFPKGYSATVWTMGRGCSFCNASGRYTGKGVEYGFVGMNGATKDVRLDSIDIKTNSSPGLDDYPKGWIICSPKVDISFPAQVDDMSAESKATATNGGKRIVLFSRIDRNSTAWAYSFDEEHGWRKPDFDDSKWKRAMGGFGSRDSPDQLRRARINTAWASDRIFLRRHFDWPGGVVSRVVMDAYHDDDVKIYLNGMHLQTLKGANFDWQPFEIIPQRFNSALRKGDNVVCIVVENTGGPGYIDCGLFVECGGEASEFSNRDGVRKVKTAAGTWTVMVKDGIAQIGDGQNVALQPRPQGKLTIPSKLDGLRIHKLAPDCFKRCDDLESVVIQEGIRSVEAAAFFNCGNLSEVTIPDSLEHLGWESFHGTSLKRIDLKNTRLLEGCAFKFCDKINEVTVSPGNHTFAVKDGVLYDRIRRAVAFCPRSKTQYAFPAGVEEVYDSAFTRCKIKKLEVPQTVKSIWVCAFEGCPDLESVEFKGEDVALGDWAFGDLPALKTLVLPYGQKSLDAWAIFCRAGELESVTLPDTVRIIGAGVFERCPKLREVHVGNSLRTVRYRAFASSPQLGEIRFPKTLRELGAEAFLGCQALKGVFFDGDAPVLTNNGTHRGNDIYKDAGENLVTYVTKDSTGWLDQSAKLPAAWPVDGGKNARPIAHSEPAEAGAGDVGRAEEVPVATYASKGKLHAAYRSNDRNRVFVEVCHAHVHTSFNTPPYTLERVREAISCRADVLQLCLCRSKDGVLFSAERENLDHISDGVGSCGDQTAKQLKRLKVKHRGAITTRGFATLEDMLKIGKGKILFKISGACDYAEDLERLLKRMDAWESVIVEGWSFRDSADRFGAAAMEKMRSGELQVMVGDREFVDWKAEAPECSVWAGNANIEQIGLKGIPQRIVVALVYGTGRAGRTDDEAGWERALNDGATVLRTNRPVELGKFLKKRRRWK